MIFGQPIFIQSLFLCFLPLVLLGCGENQLKLLDSGEQSEESQIIVNHAPDSPLLNVSPQSPGPEDSLECQVLEQPFDPDGDQVQVLFQWERNGDPAEEYTATVSNELTSIGDQWTCIGVSSDGDLQSAPNSDSVEVVSTNAPPSQPVIAISPQNPGDNHSLKCSIVDPSQDPDGDTLSYHYSWIINGETIEETSSDLSHLNTSEGDNVVCRVLVSDGLLLSEGALAQVSITGAVYGEDVTGDGALVYKCSTCSYCPDNDWYIAEKAFNNTYGTGPDTWSATWTGSPEWVSVDFGLGQEKTITRYGVMGASFHEGYRARDWELQASLDEVTWETLHSVVNADLPYVMYGGEPFTYYTLYNETAYRYYRIYVTANMGGQYYANEVNIVEIEMMENGSR